MTFGVIWLPNFSDYNYRESYEEKLRSDMCKLNQLNVFGEL